MKKYILILLICLIRLTSFSQKTVQLTGTIKDNTSKETLTGTLIKIKGIKNYNTASDLNGQFSLNISTGVYAISVYYIGYDTIQLIETINSDKNLTILLKQNAKLLKEVSVIGVQNLVKLNGDTTEHNATAYKLNTDATAEDLIKKLPGTTIENGTVKSNGEEIKKVTVDGKDFFGDDVSLTLKYLPADMISTVQIYDKTSDQSTFTGFKDGNTTKAMNIKTKNGFKNSSFGKIYGGYGSNDRYTVGGNINYFSGNRRVSLIMNFNNINQQNFAIQDILGVMGMGNMPKMPGGMNPQMMQGMMGSMPGGSDMSDFFSNSQSGINSVNAIGLNYSDNWGKKITVSGSYFYNYNINNTETNLQRQYFLSQSKNQLYNEQTVSKADNSNHRVNFKMQYNIDSANTLIINPRITYQDNSTNKNFGSKTTLDTSVFNTNNSLTKTSTNGFMFSGSVLFNHKFKKIGRTISLNVSTDNNKTDGNTKLNSNLSYLGDSLVYKNQQTQSLGKGQSYSANLIMTERIFKNSQLLFSYNPSYSMSENNKSNYAFNTQTNEYTDFNSSLSNIYSNNTITNKAGALYAYNKGKINFNTGIYFQNLELSGNQKYPLNSNSNKTFESVLPVLNFTYKVSFFQSFRLNYRTSTKVPGISQMQNVIDNSNPTSLSTGNPYLKQQYDHNITLRYNNINLSTARTFFAFAMITISQNYIGNSTFILFHDTTINNYFINKGSQLSKTQNLNGYTALRSFAAYGFKIRPIKCNLNLNVGGNYNLTPVSINNRTNISKSSVLTGGLTISSNISEKIDFTIGYTGNYNISMNSIQNNQNNNYYYDNIDAKFNITIFRALVVTSEFLRTAYYGLAAGYNKQVNLLSSSIAYKFLKNRMGEIKFSVFDVLNKNNSIDRTVSSNYLEDSQTKVLKQYYMLTFTYTFKQFKSV